MEAMAGIEFLNCMKSRLLFDQGEKIYALVFATGDEVVSLLTDFAMQNHSRACAFTAIGALREVTLGYFDLGRKDYRKIRIQEQVEVLSVVGNVAFDGGNPKIHAHIVVGKSDGTAYGGHLLEAHVRPTLEVIMNESPVYLRRQFDAQTGLALIDLDAG